MNKTAYLIIWIHRDHRTIEGAGIYSEWCPTSHKNQVPVCIAKRDANDYQEANRRMVTWILASRAFFTDLIPYLKAWGIQ